MYTRVDVTLDKNNKEFNGVINHIHVHVHV
jgi:hypothetical protein